MSELLYGPQTIEIVGVLDELPGMPCDQVAALAVEHRMIWGYVGTPPRDLARAWHALRKALDQAGRVEWGDLGPAFAAVRTQIELTGTGAAQFPIRDAVMAISARDLIGTFPGWTSEVHDRLMEPWRAVVNPGL